MIKKGLVKIFCDLVRIDSESGEEENFIAHLQDVLIKNFKAECFIDKYGNLISKIPAKKSDQTEPVLFGVHADTVKPGKNIVPIYRNGIIYSKGETVLGADDKAGIAELFEAIRTAERYPPLEIVVSKEEEVGLLGSKNLDSKLLTSKIGFVVDGPLENIVIGGPSYMAIDVKIIGKAAHAGTEPEKGISSIKVASCSIAELKEGWVDNESSINVGIIWGGEALNVVPEKTSVKIECRSKSHKKCLDHSNLIKNVFLTNANAKGAQAEVKMELLAKAYRISESAKVVKIAKKAINRVGISPNVCIESGISDALNYNKKGIETVAIGSGGKAEHTKEENISVADMVKAIDIIHYIFDELS